MATYSSIFAWEIPWTEEPGGLQFMRSQKSQTRRGDWIWAVEPLGQPHSSSSPGHHQDMTPSLLGQLEPWSEERSPILHLEPLPLCLVPLPAQASAQQPPGGPASTWPPPESYPCFFGLSPQKPSTRADAELGPCSPEGWLSPSH